MNAEAHKIVNYVIHIIEHRYDLSHEELKIRTRRRAVAFPRQVAGALIRETLGRSVTLSEIGEELGGLDHSTVHHGIDQVNNIRDTDRNFAGWYEGALTVVKIANQGIKLTVNQN